MMTIPLFTDIALSVDQIWPCTYLLSNMLWLAPWLMVTLVVATAA